MVFILYLSGTAYSVAHVKNKNINRCDSVCIGASEVDFDWLDSGKDGEHNDIDFDETTMIFSVQSDLFLRKSTVR